MKIKKLGLYLLFGMLCLVMLPNVYADDDSSTVDVPANSKDAIGNMLLQSVSLMGIPYRWGGNTPETGMDCSGFIRYVFQKSLGIDLPRTVAQMAKVGKRVSLDDIEPGDLIFFNTERGVNTHMGMYIGDNKFIQSPRTGENIQITPLTSAWIAKINGVKRMVQEDQDDDGNTTLVEYQDIRNEALPAGYSRKSHFHSKKHSRGGRKHLKTSKSHKSKKPHKKSSGQYDNE